MGFQVYFISTISIPNVLHLKVKCFPPELPALQTQTLSGCVLSLFCITSSNKGSVRQELVSFLSVQLHFLQIMPHLCIPIIFKLCSLTSIKPHYQQHTACPGVIKGLSRRQSSCTGVTEGITCLAEPLLVAMKRK